MQSEISGNIESGPPGNLNGPSIVTIGFADTCVEACQESWPDEFCSKYPPEGVPARFILNQIESVSHMYYDIF